MFVLLNFSHAIAIYLVEKYAKNDSLYPKDLVQRTKVNEVLFWDASFFFARMFQISVRNLFGLQMTIS